MGSPTITCKRVAPLKFSSMLASLNEWSQLKMNGNELETGTNWNELEPLRMIPKLPSFQSLSKKWNNVQIWNKF